jgi:plastocyanin
VGRARIGAVVAMVVGFAAPLSPVAAQSGGDIKIVDFDFAPLSQTVNVNAKVTWTNTGSRPHTVTDRGGTFDTDAVAPGKTASLNFTVPGTYHYFCRINPSKMNGILIVKAAGAAPVQRVEAVDPALPEESLRYEPPQLQATTGSAILFANVGGKPHTFTADDGTFDTGVVPPGPEGGRFAGTNVSVTISKPGTFPFHCEIHPAAMKGTLTVTGNERAGPAAASSAPRNVGIDVKDFEFAPPEASVAPGGKVTWANKGNAPHTATFDDVGLDTGRLNPGASGSVDAPQKPGSYSYKCAIHPAKMRGVLVVVGETTTDPTKQVAAQGPAAATGAKGPSGGVTTLVLVTAIVASFLGGFGISAFVRRRQTPAA